MAAMRWSPSRAIRTHLRSGGAFRQRGADGNNWDFIVPPHTLKRQAARFAAGAQIITGGADRHILVATLLAGQQADRPAALAMFTRLAARLTTESIKDSRVLMLTECLTTTMIDVRLLDNG